MTEDYFTCPLARVVTPQFPAPRRSKAEPSERTRAVSVAAARFVTVELAGTITGLGANAVRKRIERGIWLEDAQWRRAADGRIWIDMKAVERWIEQSS